MEEINLNDVVYSALFVDEPSKLKDMFPPIHVNIFYHHSTIEFKPKPVDTAKLRVGEKIRLPIIGRITTDKVDALLVNNPLSTNEFPHITLSTAAGVAPVKSNEAFKIHKALIKNFATPQYIETTVGVFVNGKTITN